MSVGLSSNLLVLWFFHIYLCYAVLTMNLTTLIKCSHVQWVLEIKLNNGEKTELDKKLHAICLDWINISG